MNDFVIFIFQVASGVVEYIDTMEEETTMIATSPEALNPADDGSYYCQTWTHVEIHPAMILGEKIFQEAMHMFKY